jgi:hypothetical protein
MKVAIKEGRTDEYLSIRFKKAKWAKKALEYARRRIRFRFAGG